MHFEALDHAYDIDLVKEMTLTRMGGDGWKEFVRRKNLAGEDQMIVFSLRGQMPMISVVYFSYGQEYPHASMSAPR